MITLPCSCVLEEHVSGARVSIRKCKKHTKQMREPVSLGEAYYRELGVLAKSTPHLRELEETLGPFEPPITNRSALEIGCGISPYAKAIGQAGWTYFGLDLSKWAVEQMRRQGHNAIWDNWEEMGVAFRFGMALCAHSLEHMKNAYHALVKIQACLTPGGALYLVIPDDSDLTNADHLWFFSQDSLAKCIEEAGLKTEVMTMRKRIERENFLYVRARKPA